jgi:hypothetical protein
MSEKKLQITPKTKIGELLGVYPELEEILLQLSPAFSKLKNPVLRRTIGRIASLQQVASTGEIPVDKLINTLRNAVGQSSLSGETPDADYLKEQPLWFDEKKVREIFDARPLINSGGSPLSDVLHKTKNLLENEIFELITPFIPVPIIDILIEKNLKIWTLKMENEKFHTFITK